MDSTALALTHLLIIAPNPMCANRLISSVRQERLSLRAANAMDEGELINLLGQDNWDVVVCFDNGQVPIERVKALLTQHVQECPLILVTSDKPIDDPLGAFRQGIYDCVADTDPRPLTLAVLRGAHQQALLRQLRKLELAQQELEKRHDMLLNTSTTPIAYLLDGVHLYCNDEYARFFGHENAAITQVKPFLNLLATSERDRLKPVLRQAVLQEQSLSVQALRDDGNEVASELHLVPVDYHGKACVQVRIAAAASNPAYNEAVTRLNTLDLVTRVANRQHFLSQLEGAIRRAVQHASFSTLLIVEIADFDDIKSVIGNSNANFLLNDIARFLQVASTESSVVGRLEEAQFALLLPGTQTDETLQLATLVKERCNSYLSAAIPNPVTLQSRVGMALINGHAANSDALLIRARQGLNSPSNASVQMKPMNNDGASPAMDLLGYLALALAERRFTLYFQPIVPIKGGSNHGYEVLVRMLDNEGNEIRPGSFLPLAILNGMGEAIDRLVTELVINSPSAATNEDSLVLNITSNTLASPAFLPWLSELLAKRRFPASRLVLELSEIDFHANLADAHAFCKGARELGLHIAISHFGTAIDAFAILDNAQPYFVTLDESVVRDVVYSSQQKASVQQLIARLHQGGTHVVAPQVEDMDVLPVLWAVGADFVQGYCLQAPAKDMNYAFVQEEVITLSVPTQ